MVVRQPSKLLGWVRFLQPLYQCEARSLYLGYFFLNRIEPGYLIFFFCGVVFKWLRMGQPSHPLMLHGGKSQLWAWGPSVALGETLYPAQARKSILGARYVLAFLRGLLIVHTSHLWAPRNWFGGGLCRLKLHRSKAASLHLPDLMRRGVRRRYFRFTPRRLGFVDGDQVFYEFAMDRRWTFFRVYAWGHVHMFRFGHFIVVCLAAVPLFTLSDKVRLARTSLKKISLGGL